MKLMVGLGNPGSTYAMNRHNVGFMAVDRIHERWRGGPWRRKFQSDVSEANIHGTRVMFLKPLTYMNESGRAVAEAARFYKVDPSDIVVIHDEIDLPPAKFRMKTGGGTGGHNGLKSIIAHMRDGFRRLRIGVGHPGRKELVPNYVLHDFAKSDFDWLEPMLDAIAEEATLLATGQDSTFSSRVHVRLSKDQAAKPSAPRDSSDAARSSADERPVSVLAKRESDQRPAQGPFSALAHLLRK
ncbi:aminoacyl-tRNA hydrolase [Acuticoccus sp. M5D2P5]|nr:aminoacyl-tRNA hydrolase [Acuticoccus kalidii]MCF3932272.1 aminoacyl-tRNA hydrolase [Acuticoccus kalidii]